MKVIQEQVSFAPGTLLKVKWDDFPSFTFPWHFHREYEIVYILKSKGQRYVGDSVEPFEEGDITLVGSYLPHFWKSDQSGKAPTRVNAIVVQFSPDLFKQEIDTYPIFRPIRELLNRSAGGLHFAAPDSLRIGRMLKRLIHLEGLEQLLYLMRLLGVMAGATACRKLAGENYLMDWYRDKDNRLDKVMQFIQTHYRQQISLREVSMAIGMNPSAFSRYFRAKTGRSFSSFLIEWRVSGACRLLMEGKLPVYQIAFESGFNNLSNFNRLFKRQMGLSPMAYQKQFSQSI